jgi:hypothetical protein
LCWPAFWADPLGTIVQLQDPMEMVVKTLFSTAEVHPRDRFDFWHEVACKTIIRHNSISENRYAFHAELQSGALAEVGLFLFENAPMSLSRAPLVLLCQKLQENQYYQ